MRLRRLWAFLALVVLCASMATVAQEEHPAVTILVVDATKTLSSTMRVAGLVGAFRQTGRLDVSVRFSDETSRFPDPLRVEEHLPANAPFDLILFLPRALDTDSDVMIWLVSHWIPSLTPQIRQTAEMVSHITNAVFEGVGETVDGWMDLWPLLMAAFYQQKGWLR